MTEPIPIRPEVESVKTESLESITDVEVDVSKGDFKARVHFNVLAIIVLILVIIGAGILLEYIEIIDISKMIEMIVGRK